MVHSSSFQGVSLHLSVVNTTVEANCFVYNRKGNNNRETKPKKNPKMSSPSPNRGRHLKKKAQKKNVRNHRTK